jgi:hypothetical protein
VELSGYRRFVMADIPGLIEGAHDGAGLGHDFLKHIERTRILLHVLDIFPSDDSDPVDNYIKIRNELEMHSKVLIEKPEVVVLNKADLDPEGQRPQVPMGLRWTPQGHAPRVLGAQRAADRRTRRAGVTGGKAGERWPGIHPLAPVPSDLPFWLRAALGRPFFCGSLRCFLLACGRPGRCGIRQSASPDRHRAMRMTNIFGVAVFAAPAELRD